MTFHFTYEYLMYSIGEDLLMYVQCTVKTSKCSLRVLVEINKCVTPIIIIQKEKKIKKI